MTWYGMLVLLMPLAAWGVMVLAVRVRVRLGECGRRAVPGAVKPLALLSAWSLAGAAAVFAYAWLVYSPGLYPDKSCMAFTGYRQFPDSYGSLPVSLVCHGVELVPAWINPVLAALACIALPAATAALGLCATSWSTRRTPPAAAHRGDPT
ncbi:hypothetical protein [Kitasatospora sp. GP82]|uniref:hypothetical protein n=1 Tax=Kitasatospora sp. GP82 TaxID=3035089 RepID=UPI0024750155|nr:hypothetical protein [Kitasatospora sp. GP82]MDH6128639.1 hypothetical protein [Kitasatospora sp. GP82]